MTNEELTTMVIQHQDRISAFTSWAEQTDRRLANLEEGQSTLTHVQITLAKLGADTERIGEKLTDMKKTLDKIDDDNKTRHEELSMRVRSIEAAPAKKWDKAVWLVITAFIGAAIGYFLKIPIG